MINLVEAFRAPSLPLCPLASSTLNEAGKFTPASLRPAWELSTSTPAVEGIDLLEHSALGKVTFAYVEHEANEGVKLLLSQRSSDETVYSLLGLLNVLAEEVSTFSISLTLTQLSGSSMAGAHSYYSHGVNISHLACALKCCNAQGTYSTERQHSSS